MSTFLCVILRPPTPKQGAFQLCVERQQEDTLTVAFFFFVIVDTSLTAQVFIDLTAVLFNAAIFVCDEYTNSLLENK